MSVRRRQVRGSAAVMLLVWAISTLGAFGPAFAAAAELSRRVFPGPAGSLHLEAGGSAGMFATLVTAGAILGGMVLLAPALNIAWLHSLATPGRLSAAVERGIRRYLPAVLVTLALTPALALALALGLALPWALSLALDDAAAPAQDVAVALAATPGLIAIAIWATWHELARARIAASEDTALAAVLAVRPALGVRSVSRYVAYFTAAALLGAVGLAATTQLPTTIAVLVGQLFIVSRIAVRSFYLAGLVAAGR